MSNTRKTKSLRILGVMTGTSCDGLDAACIEIDTNGWKPLWAKSIKYPQELRKRVFNVQKTNIRLPLKTWLALNRDLGKWYGKALLKIIKSAPAYERPELIANHGQTIGHFPEGGSRGMTLQAGDPTCISQITKLTVISQFRSGDLAAGGQGAPLAPLFHRLLAHHLNDNEYGISIHNIGGMSNLTYIGPDGQLLAFDTGPGNIWIDAAARHVTGGKKCFDYNGKLAAKGPINRETVHSFLQNKFFAKPPPKSTGRDEFPFTLFLKAMGRTPKASWVPTATALTVESIAQAYEKWVLRTGLPLRAIYFCGGGAKNQAIMHGVAARLPAIKIRNFNSTGFSPQLIEAQAFSILGFLSLIGQPLGGTWTGAKGFGPPGQITPGQNWVDVLSKLQKIMR